MLNFDFWHRKGEWPREAAGGPLETTGDHRGSSRAKIVAKDIESSNDCRGCSNIQNIWNSQKLQNMNYGIYKIYKIECLFFSENFRCFHFSKNSSVFWRCWCILFNKSLFCIYIHFSIYSKFVFIFVYRVPAGVVRGLDSVSKSVRGNWPLWPTGGLPWLPGDLPWPPVASRWRRDGRYI